MLAKSSLLGLLVILLQLNQLIPILLVTAETSSPQHVNSKNCTNRTRLERKWTDDQIDSKCKQEIVNNLNRRFRFEELIPAFPDYKLCASLMKNETKPIIECCEGYKMVNNRCVTDCKPNCKHGECDDADRCSCAIGFGGEWCENSCPAGHFGLSCEHNCDW